MVLTVGTSEYPGFDDDAAVLAAFGRPAYTYRVGPYAVLIWHKNLLRYLSP